MDNLKFTSIRTLFDKVNRDFNIPITSFEANATEWTGYGMLEIGTFYNFSPMFDTVTVEDNRVKLPMNQECFLGVKKDECFLFCKNVTVQKQGNPNGINYYTLTPNYLNFPFNNYDVEVHYLGFVKDCDGNLEVMDNVYVLQALSWNILYHYLLQGNTHPVINFDRAAAEWVDRRDKATNAILMPRPDQLDAIIAGFNSIYTEMNIQWS